MLNLASVTVGLSLLVAAASGDEALARRWADEGICPAGTCAKDGRKHAQNVKNCKKEHCFEASPVKAKK
jgi:hypothetical protein